MQFERKDVVSILLGTLLAVAGIMVDDILMVALLLALACATGCYAVITHKDISKSSRNLLCGLLIFITICAFWRIYSRSVDKELSANQGILSPAGERGADRLPESCQPPADALVTYLGGNWAWATKFPSVVLLISKRPTIVIDKTEDGNIKIDTLEAFDDRNNVIATINNNTLWVKPDTRFARPDRSTLVVFDHNNNESIRIKYLNRRRIDVRGLFYSNDRSLIKLGEHISEYKSNLLSGNCSGNNGLAQFAFD